MNKVLIVSLLIGMFMVGGVSLISYNQIQGGKDNMEGVYQGPVPQGYNLEHFRKTGETILEVEE